ncbi:hypothetical protein E2C01_076631 [Portunus trituberculatus]|uniref:Uncharacterized protein n=1 Tax=Portunus trituberculatus TaxID=210409 RepID=A0A5B7IJ79_PORTR|nr:hypothetical protein [Portunus trituberculatus]
MDAISLQENALTLLKNLGFSSRSARDRGREPANHSETTVYGPSPGKFKPRKFAKTDVIYSKFESPTVSRKPTGFSIHQRLLWRKRAPLTAPIQNNNSVSSSSTSLAQLTTKTPCNVAWRC